MNSYERTEQLGLFHTDPAEHGQKLLDALRRNIDVLNEIAVRYEIDASPAWTPDEATLVSTPEDVYDLIGPEMAGLRQEQFRVLLLNLKNGVVGQRVIYKGTVNSANVRVAEVLRPAVVEGAPSIIIAHNHPSGDPTPSPEDALVTRRIRDAARMLDIEVLDHAVIGRESVYSMKRHGLGF